MPKQTYLSPGDNFDASSDASTVLETDKSPNKKGDIEKADSFVSSASFVKPSVELTKRELILVMIGLGFAIFLAALDQTIVATALPRIASDFNALNQISWVATAYLLTTTASQPTYGKFSDIFGRKVVFLFAIIVFEVGSLLCAIAPNMTSLIIFRAIAGIGGGGIFSLVMIIISDIVSLQDRGKYQGIIGGVFGIASVVGPLMGGAFTDHVTWRWCFYINLPFGAITLAIIIFILHLPNSKGGLLEKLGRIDYIGTLFIVLATVSLLLALNWGGDKYEWSSGIIIALLVVGGFLFIVFGYIENWIAIEPVAPGRLFKDRSILACFSVNIFQGMAFFGLVYYLPLYFQVVKGRSATISGLELFPFIIGIILASIFSGQLISRKENVPKMAIAIVGGALISIGAGLTSLLSQDSNRGEMTGYLLVPGVGIGLIMQTTLLAGQGIVEYSDVAAVTSLLTFFRSIGSVFGVAIIGSIFKNQLTDKILTLNLNVPLHAVLNSATYVSELPDETRIPIINAYVEALQVAFLVVIPMGVLCFVCAWFIGPNRYRDDGEKPPVGVFSE